MTVPEAPLARSEQGLAPAGEGWFVLNAKDARWVHEGVGPKLTFFEGGAGRFEQIGINVSVMGPGEPMSMYHWEDDQEDFLIVADARALAIVEGQERPLMGRGISSTARAACKLRDRRCRRRAVRRGLGRLAHAR